MGLVTMQQAKEHLKPPLGIDDSKIERQIEEASAIVLEYIKLPFDSYQDTAGDPIATEVPPNVRAATLLVLGTLYDEAGSGCDPLTPGVKALLHSRRDPTLA